MLITLAYAVGYAALTFVIIASVLGGALVIAKWSEQLGILDGDLAFILTLLFQLFVMIYYAIL